MGEGKGVSGPRPLPVNEPTSNPMAVFLNMYRRVSGEIGLEAYDG